MRARTRLVLTCAYVALIVAAVPMVRSITNPLRDVGMLRVTVASVIVLALGLFGFLASRSGASRRGVALLMAGVISPCAVAYPFVVSPEEFLHVPQYIVVGAAWTWTLQARVSGVVGSTLGALFLTLATSLLEEGVQHVTPDRYFGWNDVALDSASGCVGVALAVFGPRLLRHTSSNREL